MASPSASSVRSGRDAAAHRHDLAVLDEEARHEHRLGEQAAAVAAQVEHDALGALACGTLSISRRSTPCAPELKPSSRPRRACCPSRSTIRLLATGTSIRSRSTFTVRESLGARGEHLEVHLRARLALDAARSPARCSARRSSGRSPTGSGRRLRMPACFAGEPSNTLSTRRPRLSSSTVMPTPSNSPDTDSWNALRLLRGEVVRVGVVERLDDPLERSVVELRLVDLLVEVVLDRVDDLGAQRAVLLDEDVAHAARAACSGGRRGRCRRTARPARRR